MATKTISKTSDRKAQEKRLHANLREIFDSGDEEAIKAVLAIFRLIMPKIKKRKGGVA